MKYTKRQYIPYAPIDENARQKEADVREKEPEQIPFLV